MSAARRLLSDAVRGGLLITLKLGEMPTHIPGWRACTRYGTPVADRIDGGVLDRLLRHHGGAMRAVRLHSARTPRRDRDVVGAYRFDDIEQISGVARVLRVRVREAEGVPPLLQALAELPVVERVAPVTVCHTPSPFFFPLQAAANFITPHPFLQISLLLPL
ncbi:MAG: hypothetical protein J0M09_14245 [Xanthomonadales bacterium]|nr:hypothetical protein [Xanthomonadales bacterium]